jgi:predicted HD phosphohydrolase
VSPDSVVPLSSVEQVFEFFAHAAGPTAYDEPIPLIDHSLQTARILHSDFPADPQLAVAGFLHDFGHMAGADATMHAEAGALWLAGIFPPRVIDLIGLHVVAKRYLIATSLDYEHLLSGRSAETLQMQGGALSQSQVDDFVDHPLFSEAVALRRADERSKLDHTDRDDLGYWRELIGRTALR